MPANGNLFHGTDTGDSALHTGLYQILQQLARHPEGIIQISQNITILMGKRFLFICAGYPDQLRKRFITAQSGHIGHRFLRLFLPDLHFPECHRSLFFGHGSLRFTQYPLCSGRHSGMKIQKHDPRQLFLGIKTQGKHTLPLPVGKPAAHILLGTIQIIRNGRQAQLPLGCLKLSQQKQIYFYVFPVCPGHIAVKEQV